ncbi:MAG: GNAT family N-acetyltransferase [Pseudomonadota bacterium]
MSIAIRRATPDDAATIAAFNQGIATETEHKHLDDDIVGRGVAALLENGVDGRYWLAEVDGIVAGQIMVTYEWSDWRNGRVWWIQSVYVAPDYRRRGVFSALYRHVESLVRDDPTACGIRLYMEENNQSAQRAYEKLGMAMTPYRVMEVMLSDEPGEKPHA